MAGPLFVADLSRYQAGIDVAQIARDGIVGVIAKVSQGDSGRDPEWPRHRDATRRAGMLLAGYHYVTTEPAAAQAANCRAALGDVSIPLALDWEDSSGPWSNFLAVVAAFRTAGLRPVLAYAPRWYWTQQGSPDLRGAGLPLWSSRYVTTDGVPGEIYAAVPAERWQGYGGAEVALLQFTDHARIAGQCIDCSAFRGTRAHLAQLFGATAPTPPRPVQEDVMFIRSRPDPTKPASIALLSGPMFVGLTGSAAASAELAISKGAVVLDVGAAVWNDLDRRSHNLCDNPRPVTVAPGTMVTDTRAI